MSDTNRLEPSHLRGLGRAMPESVSTEWMAAASGPDATYVSSWLKRNGDDGVWCRQIVCRCGAADAYAVWSAGDDHPGWVGGEQGGTRRVELRCGSCDVAVLLFDDGLHGYNAVVCDDRAGLPEDYAGTNQGLLTESACGCGGSRSAVVAQAVYDLYDEDLAEIPEDLWDDSFGSFAAAGRCASCGAVTEIAAAETA